MRPPVHELIFSQIFYTSMSILFMLLAYLFYKWKDGNVRIALIAFMACLSWNFLVEGIYWFLWDVHVYEGIQPISIRFVKNVPLLISALYLAYTLDIIDFVRRIIRK